MDNKYIDGKIYEIISDNTDMVYIGSCIVTLKERLIQHKNKANTCSSKSIIDCGDYDIYLIEKYSCNNNLELRIREQIYIDIYKNNGKNVINLQNAYTSTEDKQKYHKEYKKNNKRQNYEYQKEYYKCNCEKLKNTEKQWYKDNREKQQEYYKEYYKNNKEIQSERDLFRSKKVCNGFYNLSMMLNEY